MMRGWFLILLYGALGSLLYATSLDNGFHYDDEYVIVKNKGLSHPGRFLTVFTGMEQAGESPLYRAHYRPVVYASYILNYVVGGLNPIGYHLVNLLIHVLAAFLVALVLKELIGTWKTGALAGILFLIHPVNAESVNYITARSSQLYTLFYLLSFYAYVRFRPPFRTQDPVLAGDKVSSRSGRYPLFWLSLCFLAFVLAMLSKEMAVTLPVTIALYEWLLRPPAGWKERLRNLGIPLTAGMLVIVLYLLIRKTLVGVVLSPEGVQDWIGQIATQMVVQARTFGLILFPAGLTIDHPVKIYRTFSAWPVVIAVLTGCILLGFALKWGIRKEFQARVRSFLLIWFFAVLSPLLVLPLNAMLQENRAYLAAVGVIGLAAVGLSRLTDDARKRIWVSRGIWAGMGLLFVVFGGMTFQRNAVWQDDLSLWTDALQKNPISSQAHLALGSVYQDRKEFSRAIQEYQETLRIKPEEYRARGNLAQLYRQQGLYDLSILEYRKILHRAPGDPEAHYGLGRTFHLAGDLDLALQEYQDTLSLDPGHEQALLRLGILYAGRGNLQEATATLQRLLRVNPENTDAYNALGLIALREGDSAKGITWFQTAVRLAPENIEYRRNLAAALARAKQP